ncbi:tetratricopeptide repeat protein [Candidatus Cloacimonadota bacterium]
MATKEKIAFGIFQDGSSIKVAQMIFKNGSFRVETLEETILSTPLYTEDEIETSEISKLPENEPEFDNLMDIDEESFELPEISEFDQEAELDNIAMKKDDSLPGLRELQNFLQIFPLEKGKIGLNANEEQVSYFQFDASFAKSKLLQKLKEEMLSAEERKAKFFTIDYILNPNKSGLAFVHRGKFDLFHALRDINLILSKERYFYSFIDTNEIALMNLIRHNYSFEPKDYVLMLYIGMDYKVGIVMKDNVHVKTFPIIVPESDPESMRQAIFSKVLLEQDISDINITKNVILMGDQTTDDDLEFFRSKGTEDDNITRLELQKLQDLENIETSFDDQKIARYAIPIALAWKALDAKNSDFYQSNLLPEKVVQNQKYFKIAWHGFLILVLIFYFAFSGTIKNLQIKQNKVKYEQKNYAAESELRRNRGLIAKLNDIKNKLNVLETNFDTVEKLSGNKNLWYYILSKISKLTKNEPITWLEDLSSSNDNFSISGYSTNRRSIIPLANLFPKGTISEITKYDLQEQTVWRYEITYDYPDVKVVKAEEQVVPKDTSDEQVERQEDATQVFEDTEIAQTQEDIQRSEQISGATAEDINREYRHTLDVYFAGDYPTALKMFNEFLDKYYDHQLAYNATYFKGECLYVLKNYQEAMNVFEKIFQDRGKKAPDALMMLGNCWEKMGEKDMARASWNNLIADYPAEELAIAAKYKLSKMENK